MSAERDAIGREYLDVCGRLDKLRDEAQMLWSKLCTLTQCSTIAKLCHLGHEIGADGGMPGIEEARATFDALAECARDAFRASNTKLRLERRMAELGRK